MEFESRDAGASDRRRRDSALREALWLVEKNLDPSTVTAYLVTESGERLSAAMTLDTPLGFTVLPDVPLNDLKYAVSLAYHSEGPVIMGAKEIRDRIIDPHPAMVQFGPFPMVAVCWPLRAKEYRFGAVAARWVPPQDIDWEVVLKVQAGLDDLMPTLALCMEDEGNVFAPFAPVFIPGSKSDAVESRSSSIVFRLQRLTAELTGAVNTRDVVAAARDHIMIPCGGNAMLLGLWESGRLRIAGSVGVSKEDRNRIDGMSISRRSPESDATVSVQAQFFENAQQLRTAYPDLELYDDTRPRAVYPLIANGVVVGCFVLVLEPPCKRSFEETAVITAMLGQVAQTLDRTRSYDQEHALTQELQGGLLPMHLPHFSEVDTTARYLPATDRAQVGGDWYDVMKLPQGRIGLVVGDVEGHNLEAAGVMGQIRAAVRAYAAEGHDPATVLDRCNRLLNELDTGLFATCCCLWFDPGTGDAVTASAGNPYPLAVDAHARALPIRECAGPPLGVVPDARFVQTEVVLPTGATIALFSDGLLETRQFGTTDALARISRSLSQNAGDNLEVLADRLLTDTRSSEATRDDVALLLMRCEGQKRSGSGRIAQMFVQRHDLQSVRLVRNFLGDTISDWHRESVLDELQLLASEVVTNALIHAHSEVEIKVREYADRVRTEVRDTDPHPPIPTITYDSPKAEAESAESGRGLFIVDSIADSWGSSPIGRGKTTWFELRTSSNG
ncbi:SpoIIE family protein phosphatase [Streptomyces sp. NPDC059215]|uniref:ATP-binding SpoIIE family protein phosphatase n=1 Tax=Streptomyces sp. NPDC059215 TaxID=3346772 RepID=UPI0036B76297